MSGLEAVDIVKRYGETAAVNGVSLGVEPGKILGLLGPNGAGKTTTVSILAGLLRPDAGEVRFGGRPVAGDAGEWKRRFGLVPQELALFEDLSAKRNLWYFGSLQGLKGEALDDSMTGALDFVGLLDRGRDKVGAFSGGMKRRLNMAVGILHDPEVLLLDEPTVGVDPQSRNAIFENIEALRRRGKGLLYTTHYMEEAERLCDRILIMDRGKIIADGTVSSLAAKLPAENRLVLEVDAEEGEWVEGMKTLEGIEDATFEREGLVLHVGSIAEGSAAALAFLEREGIALRSIESSRADLEEVFLTLTGRRMRDG